MKFNTNDLGYKLLSGKLRQSRKHSEQLNKFLAGLFDADGNVHLQHRKLKDGGSYVVLSSSISQSESNDPDGLMLKALRDYYDLGVIRFRKTSENRTDRYIWELSTKHSKMMFNRIGKHLYIKYNTFQDFIDVHEYWKDIDKDSLKLLRKVSRESSCIRARLRKHIPTAYLAGLIAGDGYIRAVFNRNRWSKKYNKMYQINEVVIVIELHQMDIKILEQLKTDWKGGLHTTSRGTVVWRLPLGKGNHSKAVTLIPKLIGYMCLEKKYEKLIEIREFHKRVTETKQVRPDKGMR